MPIPFGLMLRSQKSGRPAITTSAIIFYRLDEQSGGAGTFDNWGTDGTLPLTSDGAVDGTVAGVFGTAASFNGVAAFNDLKSGTTTKGEAAGSVTISCWVKPTVFAANYGIIFGKLYRPIASGYTSPYLSLAFSYVNAAEGSFGAYISVSGSVYSIGGVVGSLGANPVRLRLGYWNNITARFDAVAHTFSLFFNGVSVASYTLAGTGTDWGTNGDWCIGGNPASSGDRNNHVVDECGVWASALSDANILSIYSAATVPSAPVLATPTFDPSAVSLQPGDSYNAGGLAGSWGHRFRLANPAVFAGFYWNNFAFTNGINSTYFTWKFSLWRNSDLVRLGGVTFAPTSIGRQILTISSISLPAGDYTIGYSDSGNPANVIQIYFSSMSAPSPIPHAEGGGFTWLNLGARSTGTGDVYPDTDGSPSNLGTQPGTLSPIFI